MKEKLLKIFRSAVKPFLGKGVGKFYPVKLAYKFFTFFFNPISVNGSKMYLDETDSLELLLNPNYEEMETELFKKEIKPGDVILDIGANSGYYTLIAAKMVGEKGKVFAFEPDPNNFSLLSKNVKINNYNNVIIVKEAVSDKNGQCRLYLYEEDVHNKINDSSDKFSKRYDDENKRKFIEIKTNRLDDYFKGYDREINFIKMDIEGSEGLAIKGMTSLFKKNGTKKMIVEFYPHLIREYGLNPAESLDTLVKSGFKVYEVDNKTKEVNLIKSNEIKEFCRDRRQTCLLCLKQ